MSEEEASLKTILTKMNYLTERVEKIDAKVDYQTNDIKMKLKSLAKKSNVLLKAGGQQTGSPIKVEAYYNDSDLRMEEDYQPDGRRSRPRNSPYVR